MFVRVESLFVPFFMFIAGVSYLFSLIVWSRDGGGSIVWLVVGGYVLAGFVMCCLVSAFEGECVCPFHSVFALFMR